MGDEWLFDEYGKAKWGHGNIPDMTLNDWRENPGDGGHATGHAGSPAHASASGNDRLPAIPPPGMRRVVTCYDDLRPVAWKDIPESDPDPIPMYMSTSAARIMMGLDDPGDWDSDWDGYDDRHGWDGETRGMARPVDRQAGGAMIRRGGSSRGTGSWRSSEMVRYAKVIGIDVALAVAAVILFSPGLLALSPMDADLVRSAVAVAAIVALAGTAAVSNVKLLSAPKHRILEIGTGNDDAISSFDDIYTTLVDYHDARIVGNYAYNATQQLEDAARKRQRLDTTINSKFERGSLSWQRFSSLLESVMTTVTRNAAMIANKVQAFDDEGYLRSRDLIESGDYRYDQIPDDIQEERHAIYEETLTSMQDILNANERLILEMDRFASELSRLDSTSLSTESDEMLEEIKRLVDETRYYAN